MSAEEIYKDAFYQAYERLSREDLFDWVMEDRIAYHKSEVDANDIYAVLSYYGIDEPKASAIEESIKSKLKE